MHTPKAHPLGCHRRRVPDRQVLEGIFFVLRKGCQWNALIATGICKLIPCLAHEEMHLRQVRDMGLPRFLVEYLLELARVGYYQNRF